MIRNRQYGGSSLGCQPDKHDLTECRCCGAPRPEPSVPDLDAIRARATKRTPGPPFYPPCTDDAEFIAHAREDVLALLDEIERLRALNAEQATEIGKLNEEAEEQKDSLDRREYGPA